VVSVLRDAPQNGVRNKAYKMVVSDSAEKRSAKWCQEQGMLSRYVACSLDSALMFRACLDGKKSLEKIAHYSSHRIFGRMYGALNIGKKITNCTVCL
jgi:hypothetical protein